MSRKTLHPPPGLGRELRKKPAARALLLALACARLARPAAERCACEIECYPGVPYHRHMLWKVAFYAGARLTLRHGERPRGRPSRPALRLVWPDATASPGGRPPEPPPPPGWFAGALNAGARGESKTRVAEAFARAFGYPLAVDPTAHRGSCVAKTDGRNGAHDGRVVNCPVEAADPGVAYQVLVDNREDGMVLDHRVPLVAGDIPFVYLKRRPVADRFGNANAAVAVARPEEVFSAEECYRLAAFGREMGLELGGEVDVLRDRGSGRLYVVDSNWTAWGPPRPIATADAVRAVRAYAAALARLVERRAVA